jgi:GNAT superfamily N-acetyltransferase
VRAATPADLPALERLLRAQHAECPHAPLDDRRLLDGIAEVLAEGVALVATGPDGAPVGTMGLVLDSPWFSREEWLSDRWMFVHPAHRRTPHARSLLEAAKGLARANGLRLQITLTGHGPRIPGKIRLFQRALGQPTGALWTVS